VIAARLALAGLLVAAPLQAQLTRYLSAGLDAGSVKLQTAPISGTAEVLSGVVIGGSGSLSFRIVSLHGSYSEGNLTADSGNAASRDLVDGTLMLAIRPVRWLALRAGKHLRSYIGTSGTRRLETWEAGLRVEGPLVGDQVRAHVDAFRSLSASVNVGAALSHLQGGSAGVTFHLPRAPVWGRITYRIDQAETTDGGTETLDGIILAIGFGGR